MQDPRTVSVTPVASRAPDGRYDRITWVVVDVDGKERRITMRGKITDSKLGGIADEATDARVPILPDYAPVTGKTPPGPPGFQHTPKPTRQALARAMRRKRKGKR